MPALRVMLILAAASALLPAARAHALPADRTAFYSIYDNPGDPNGQVVYTVKLSLSAQDASGNAVGWQIDEIRIRKSAAGSEPARDWRETLPAVGSPDGLWWITHADPNKPEIDEFALPPALDGVATALSSSDPDLDYALAGVIYFPPLPPALPPYPHTARLDYSFRMADDPDPDKEGDDEVVEADGGESNPS